MLFHELSFLLFLALVYAAYWRLTGARLWLLALANATFYLAAGPANLALFVGASLATYLIGGRVLGAYGRAWLWFGILANVANLAFFKYAGFLAAADWARDVLLPIGISFYTFQHISYLVDRRTRDLPAAPSYLQFWVYISFFGHSIAGPIMRGHEFFPQIAQTATKQWDPVATRLAVGLITLGLVKKLGLADPIGATVDMYFAAPAALSLGEAWAAALLFAFQIYYDFSAYSDMAVGIGLLFGYQLRQNFRTPYVAADPSEFWRRWHVTLSEWIRDYVYFPLGGNRRGAARAQLNLAIAMLASGLWHGASWTFVFWGAWHALMLVGLRGWRALRGDLAAAWFAGPAWRVVATSGFFLLVTLGWVFFRAASLEDAWILLAAMLDPRGLASLLTVKRLLLVIAGLYTLHVAEAWLRRDDGVRADALFRAIPWPVRGSLAAALVLGYMFVYGGSRDFIYFQF